MPEEPISPTTVWVEMRRTRRHLSFPVATSTTRLPVGNEVDRVGGFCFAIQDLRAFDILALEITKEVADPDIWAELVLEPRLKTGGARFRIEICLGEQLIFAPGQREIEIGDGPVLASCRGRAHHARTPHELDGDRVEQTSVTPRWSQKFRNLVRLAMAEESVPDTIPKSRITYSTRSEDTKSMSLRIRSKQTLGGAKENITG